jgi:pentose-5-phosphate-3-epimerase
MSESRLNLWQRDNLLGEVGLALDGPTDLSAITVSYDDLDCVTFFMSQIRVGFSGPPMLPERLGKSKGFSEKNQTYRSKLMGGVKDTTIQLAKEAGATRFVATSFISTDPLDPKSCL